eukprot:421810-Prymnesium_polylepis.1
MPCVLGRAIAQLATRASVSALAVAVAIAAFACVGTTATRGPASAKLAWPHLCCCGRVAPVTRVQVQRRERGIHKAVDTVQAWHTCGL